MQIAKQNLKFFQRFYQKQRKPTGNAWLSSPDPGACPDPGPDPGSMFRVLSQDHFVISSQYHLLSAPLNSVLFNIPPISLPKAFLKLEK